MIEPSPWNIQENQATVPIGFTYSSSLGNGKKKMKCPSFVADTENVKFSFRYS